MASLQAGTDLTRVHAWMATISAYRSWCGGWQHEEAASRRSASWPVITSRAGLESVSIAGSASLECSASAIIRRLLDRGMATVTATSSIERSVATIASSGCRVRCTQPAVRRCARSRPASCGLHAHAPEFRLGSSPLGGAQRTTFGFRATADVSLAPCSVARSPCAWSLSRRPLCTSQARPPRSGPPPGPRSRWLGSTPV